MNLKDFRAGRWRQEYKYKSFRPEKINHEWVVDNPQTQALLSEAARMIGELNAYGHQVPNVDFFIQMHVTKEATASSSIEGTQTTMEEALVEREVIDPDRRNDWLEVHNYVQAMNFALESLKSLPLSNRLLKETHRILLSSGRGKSKQPGDFRSSQNWIGPSLNDAVFVPPPHEEVHELMSDLERFLHNDNIFAPQLVRIAIAHYQFETIHPFLDGNGRLGRLMITLYLVSCGLLEKPTLYLSAHLEKHRRFYYDYLTAARVNNDLDRWVRFFLAGVIETSKSSIQTFKSIRDLREDIERKRIPQFGKRAPRALALSELLYKKPIVTSIDVQQALGVTPATASALLADFEQCEILREFTGFKRNRVFAFDPYITIFEDKSD